MTHFSKAATELDIVAVNLAAARLNMTQLSRTVSAAVAPFGLSALLECALAAQPSAASSALRALLYQEAAQRIAALEALEGEAALYA